ncbi:MAG: hypothetical protein Q4A09_08105 [Capnocytophaga felis]|nr:hypothetical protein [Capnocytophaga felis]
MKTLNNTQVDAVTGAGWFDSVRDFFSGRDEKRDDTTKDDKPEKTINPGVRDNNNGFTVWRSDDKNVEIKVHGEKLRDPLYKKDAGIQVGISLNLKF